MLECVIGCVTAGDKFESLSLEAFLPGLWQLVTMKNLDAKGKIPFALMSSDCTGFNQTGTGLACFRRDGSGGTKRILSFLTSTVANGHGSNLISSLEMLPAEKSYLKFMGDEALEYFLTTDNSGKWTTSVQSLDDVTAEALLSFMSYRGGIKSRDLGLAIHNKSHPKLEEAGVDNFGSLAVKKGTGIHNKSHPKLEEAGVDNLGALAVKNGLGIHSKSQIKDVLLDSIARTGGTAQQTMYCLSTNGVGTANWHNGDTAIKLACNSCNRRHTMFDQATFEKKKNEACVNFPECIKTKYKIRGKVLDSGKCRTCYNK